MEDLFKNKEFEISHRNPFKVPDGYFDTLTDRVMASIENEAPTQHSKGLIVHLRPVIWIAASILLVAIGIYFPTKVAKTEQEELAQRIEEMTTLDRFAWFSENEILDMISEESVNEDALYDESVEQEILSRVSDYDLYYLASF